LRWANAQTGFHLPGIENWATRGAINAGLAVFLFLQEFERGTITPKPLFNQCEKLPH
jgi:hypothetical protein